MFWMMDVAIFQAYQIGGALLVVLLQSLVVTSAYALLLWLGLVSGAAIGALMFSIFGLNSLWLPAGYAGVFAMVLLVSRDRFSL